MITVLIFYGLFLLIFFVFSLFALYQIWQFGYVGDLSQRIVYLYIFTSIVVIIGSFLLFLWAGRT